MRKIISNIIEKLKTGTITTDEANESLFDLFCIIKGNSLMFFDWCCCWNNDNNISNYFILIYLKLTI